MLLLYLWIFFKSNVFLLLCVQLIVLSLIIVNIQSSFCLTHLFYFFIKWMFRLIINFSINLINIFTCLLYCLVFIILFILLVEDTTLIETNYIALKQFFLLKYIHQILFFTYFNWILRIINWDYSFRNCFFFSCLFFVA